MATPRKDPSEYLKVGRPCEYRPEYADMLIEYFSRPAWDVQDENGKTVEGYFPTLAGFCWEIGTTQKTLLSWANSKDIDGSPLFPEFLKAYHISKERQEQLFTLGYMRGKYYNPAIGALIAKNLMAWKDKQEIEQTGETTVTLDGAVGVAVSGLSNRLAAVKAATKPTE